MIENGKNIIECESGRISNLSIPVSSNLIDENHKAYVNFISSLKSPNTNKTYVFQLKNYLRSPPISFSTFDELLSRNPSIIEQSIIDILIDMRHRRQLSYSSQNGFLAEITHFFSINDISLNRKRLKSL